METQINVEFVIHVRSNRNTLVMNAVLQQVPLVLLSGVSPEPVTLDHVVCVFEGEDMPEWVDNQIDVVVEIDADGVSVARVDTELPPNYVGPTLLVKKATFEEGRLLILEGEDLRFDRICSSHNVAGVLKTSTVPLCLRNSKKGTKCCTPYCRA